MKKNKNKNWLLIAALVGVPMSSFAVITYFSNVAVSDTGEIGFSNFVSSANRVLSVGAFNSHGVAANNAAIGTSLFVPDNGCLVVGQWNETSTAGDEDLFILGNGTGANDKSNAFEVYKNGDVIIPKVQGDVSMGSFGN